MFNILLCDVELSPYELESLKLGLNLDKFGTRKTFQVLNVKVSVAIVWRLDLGRTPPSWTPLLRCKVNRRARLLDGVAQFAHNKVDLDSGCLQIFLLFTILCFELLNHFIFLEILLVVELITEIKLWALSLCLFWIGDSLLPIPL
ncbi:unnamed protein product [Malus baccata var. baccata]